MSVFPLFTITEDWPTPLLKDFECFLKGVETPSAYVTKARHTLDRKTLYSINKQMLTHRTDTHNRTDQHYYPLLHMFQRICMAGLYRLRPDHGKLRMAPADALTVFRGFSPAERYITLLKILWMDCDWNDLLGAARYSYIPWLIDFLEKIYFFPIEEEVILQQWAKQLEPNNKSKGLFIFPGPMLRLLSFFGFLTYRVDETTASKSIYYKKSDFAVYSLTITKLGSAFIRILVEKRPFAYWNIPFSEEFGSLYAYVEEKKVDTPIKEFDYEEEEEPFFKAFVPVLKKGTLTQSLLRREPEIQEGTFVFRVSLGKVWRVIAFSARHTLEDLHLAIQDAFSFDNDHLYAFYMDGRLWSRHHFGDPRGSEGPFADEAEIGKLDLFPGQRFLYIFDFGSTWRFNVELTEIRNEPVSSTPIILKQRGASPEQYPDEE